MAAPIYLENRYTFTNYEFARGHVYFKNGFDLPVNCTVVLNILDPVSWTIVLKADSTTQLLATSDTIFEFESGARFILTPGTKIKLY